MVTMKALKTFRVGDSRKIVSPGEEFETKNTKDYEARGLAVPVKIGGKRTPPRRVENKAAAAGPLASPGGATGAVTSQSLSPAVRVRKPRRSRNAGGTLV